MLKIDNSQKLKAWDIWYFNLFWCAWLFVDSVLNIYSEAFIFWDYKCILGYEIIRYLY